MQHETNESINQATVIFAIGVVVVFVIKVCCKKANPIPSNAGLTANNASLDTKVIVHFKNQY